MLRKGFRKLIFLSAFSTSSKSQNQDDSSSTDSSEMGESSNEIDDLFVDSVIGKESFIGIVHSG